VKEETVGTNFYWIEPTPTCPHCHETIGEPRRGAHIGKRSAAGHFCWDCGVVLNTAGNVGIHSGNGTPLDACPKCNKSYVPEKFGKGASGVELGFAKPRDERPTGIASTASWTWAQPAEEVRARCEASMDVVILRDEYGRDMTGREFLTMLRANIGIEYSHSIGREFS
jgi:hypothetical protein